MHLEHVNLTVGNLEDSLHFYTSLLGLELRWKGTTNNGLPAAHVGKRNFYLALFQAAQPGQSSNDYEQVGLNHFGLVVDDLDSARSRLRELGIEPHHEPEYPPDRRLYFFDRDGIEVELVELSANREARP